MCARLLALAKVPQLTTVHPSSSADTGIYVLERLASHGAKMRSEYPTLELETLLANPKAHEANRKQAVAATGLCTKADQRPAALVAGRFIDDDLNRMFSRSMLADLNRPGYEPNRAKAIEQALGPKGEAAAAEVCIDLHTTTANMGCTIIVCSYCKLALRAAAYVREHWQSACEAESPVAGGGAVDALRVYLHDGGTQARALQTRRPAAHVARRGIAPLTGEHRRPARAQADSPYLCSVARHGITVEVGPTAQGLLRADAVAATERALRLLLAFFDAHFAGKEPSPPSSLQVFLDRGKVAWAAGPVQSAVGSTLPSSLVAPSLQDKDYEPLHEGEPLFVHLDGTVVPYDGSCGELPRLPSARRAAPPSRHSCAPTATRLPVRPPISQARLCTPSSSMRLPTTTQSRDAGLA